MRGAAERKFNMVAGTLMWATGLVLLASGIYANHVPLPKKPAPLPDANRVIDAASCVDVLTSLGMRAFMDNKAGTITASGDVQEGTSTPDNLVRISLGMSVCKMPALNFCYKKGCLSNPYGFQLVLATKGQTGYDVAKAEFEKKQGKDKSPAAQALKPQGAAH